MFSSFLICRISLPIIIVVALYIPVPTGPNTLSCDHNNMLALLSMLLHINSIFVPLSWSTVPEQSLTRPAVVGLFQFLGLQLFAWTIILSAPIDRNWWVPYTRLNHRPWRPRINTQASFSNHDSMHRNHYLFVIRSQSPDTIGSNENTPNGITSHYDAHQDSIK
jgi:hypothetical protein